MPKDRLGRLPTVAEGVVYETVAGRHVFDSFEVLQSWGKGGRIISCRSEMDMAFAPFSIGKDSLSTSTNGGCSAPFRGIPIPIPLSLQHHLVDTLFLNK